MDERSEKLKEDLHQELLEVKVFGLRMQNMFRSILTMFGLSAYFVVLVILLFLWQISALET